MHANDPAGSLALCEVFSSSCDGAAAGFVLARLAQSARSDRLVVWVQDRMAAREAGVPSVRGLDGWGVPGGMIRVCARNAKDLLWTMEEALGCSSLSAVIGEVWGSPRALDFTATKRLVLRAEASGVPAYLLRVGAMPTLSAAHERWRVGALPSALHPYDRKAPGEPRFALDLFRARRRRPGRWEAHYDRTAHRLDLAARLPDGAMDADAPPLRRSAGE